jgi:hypothetical protein
MPGIEDIEFPSVSRATVVGITFAIVGNVLISFALNLQKLAHARLEAARAERGHRSEGTEPAAEGDTGEGFGAMGSDVQRELSLPPEVEREARVWHGSSSETSLPLGPRSETEPLIAIPVPASADMPSIAPTYGALFPSTHEGSVTPRRYPKTAKQPGLEVAEEYPNRPTSHGPDNESEYLKSKIWYAFPAFSRTTMI